MGLHGKFLSKICPKNSVEIFITAAVKYNELCRNNILFHYLCSCDRLKLNDKKKKIHKIFEISKNICSFIVMTLVANLTVLLFRFWFLRGCENCTLILYIFGGEGITLIVSFKYITVKRGKVEKFFQHSINFSALLGMIFHFWLMGWSFWGRMNGWRRL